MLDVENLPGGFAYLYLVLTGLAVTFVLSGNSWTRSSRLALGLPISARTVWTVRMASLISIALLSTAALAVATGITVDLHQGTVAFNSVILLTASARRGDLRAHSLPLPASACRRRAAFRSRRHMSSTWSSSA